MRFYVEDRNFDDLVIHVVVQNWRHVRKLRRNLREKMGKVTKSKKRFAYYLGHSFNKKLHKMIDKGEI